MITSHQISNISILISKITFNIFLYSLLTPRSRAHVEKKSFFQLSRNYPHYMNFQWSLHYVKKPITYSYPEPD